MTSVNSLVTDSREGGRRLDGHFGFSEQCLFSDMYGRY